MTVSLLSAFQTIENEVVYLGEIVQWFCAIFPFKPQNHLFYKYFGQLGLRTLINRSFCQKLFATKFDSAYSSSFTEILIKSSKILWSCLDRSEIRFFLILEMSSLISGAISDNGNCLFDCGLILLYWFEN